MVVLHTTFGDIKLKMFEDKAPITVANFLSYVKDGFYDNTIFHRVIDNFMVQGGGFSAGMEEKESNESIRNEANNGLSNKIGTVAMARTQDPHSASAQFFINVADNTFLDFKNESVQGWGYCVFAEVVEGMDVIERIKEVQTGNFGFHQDVPTEEVLVTSAEVVEV
ncbi:peptidylprolyl isomerase [Echinimonas agarilytica]|uniref:Peptidyl-prolyl cis-trans isomerase n=1 Tax=Echinimonas agarilytica TaxID=1215918 RepID=A0AA41W5V8_9GAMM|nr:peptidylprolyl isomerase [Echinimonas agarilytica]MCM2679263.1 peptidylprolyl isomerase [Echinimonas agarilytica]